MVETGVVEGLADLLERPTHFPPEEDLLKPEKILARVPPVAGRGSAAGPEEADRVVVMKGSDRHPRDRRDLADLVGLRLAHEEEPGGSRCVRVKTESSRQQSEAHAEGARATTASIPVRRAREGGTLDCRENVPPSPAEARALEDRVGALSPGG